MVKISSTNVKLETTMQQKEETFQVVIDVIKNSTCFKAFTITTEVPEIFMQQFWYTIKKDICLRVEGEEFTEVQDDDVALTFLIDLGYKDFAIQIDHMKERKSRRETMPFPRFTKVIINHFLSQHKSLFKLQFQHYHTIKDDGIVNRLKFVRIGEDYQEYGLPIPDMMLNEKIKQLESYQMFIKYSSGQIPPKKSRGKGSQGKKTADVSQESIDVSKESEHEPAKKKTGSRSTRGVNKKLQILCKLSKKARKLAGQPCTGGSNEGIEMKDKDGDADDEGDDHISDIQDTNDEDAETESDEDEIYKDGDEENTNVVKPDARNTEEVKDDAKKAELPPTSFNLYVSSGFGNQFLKLLYDTSLVSTVKDTIDAEINSLLDIKIQSEVPHIQSPSVLRVPVSVIYEPSVLTQVQETPSVAPITTLPPPFVSTIPPVPHQTTAPIPTQPITADAPTITTVVPKSDM
ncbi:hypothetical protein Tco_0576672 [Tanacetum coccineum]